jgi:hypothetical protein
MPTMRKISWSVDNDGALVGANLHDGYLYGVIQESDSLILYARTSDQLICNLKLVGLREMNVTDFWIGSIVSDIWLWPREKAPSRMWQQIFAGRISVNDPEASLKLLKSKSDGKHFFALEGSYGVNVYAICDDVEITREE